MAKDSQDLNPGCLTAEPVLLCHLTRHFSVYSTCFINPVLILLGVYPPQVKLLWCISIFLPLYMSSLLLEICPIFQSSEKPSTVYFIQLLISFFGIFTWMISIALTHYSLKGIQVCPFVHSYKLFCNMNFIKVDV